MISELELGALVRGMKSVDQYTSPASTSDLPPYRQTKAGHSWVLAQIQHRITYIMRAMDFSVGTGTTADLYEDVN